MTIVDHRVLVNAPPEVAWELLGDLEALPKWHINCTATSMLTTQHEGVGVRRRNTMRGGPDVVEEIISWYPNLGFEYVIVDGPRYRSNRGRIRLQPIPEGTVIQWTFEYQLGGFLSGPRDSFHRRRLDDELARSLKRFKQLVESSGVRMDAATIERVAMRAAPSAAERAAIGEAATRSRQQRVELPADGSPTPPEPTISRMPPALPETPPQPIRAVPVEPVPFDDEPPPALPAITEPPLADEDTRPRPAVSPEPEPAADLFDLAESPAWMAPEAGPLPEIDEHEADTITEAPTRPDREPPSPEATAPEPIEALVTAETRLPAEPVIEETPAPPEATRPSVSIPEPEASPEIPELTPTPPMPMPAVEPPIEPAPPARDQAPTPPSTPPVTAEPAESGLPRAAAPDASILDRDVAPVGPSIWEVFGIDRPGGEEASAAEAAPEANEGAAPLPTTARRSARRRPAIRARAFQRAQGLRLRLNKKLARRLRHRIKKAGP